MSHGYQCLYKPKLCPIKNHSSVLDCIMAHSKEEIMYHPCVYKTQMCENGQECIAKIRCDKAHSPNELRTEFARKYFTP